MFEEEDDIIPQSSQAQPTLPQIPAQELNNLAKGKSKTIKFDTIVKFFQRFTALRGVKKAVYAKDFIKLIFKTYRNPEFTYSVLRLILPAEDKNRGNYGLKQKSLAKIVTEALSLQKQDGQRLYHYKNPSYHQRGIGIGDFSLCLFDVVNKYCRARSQLTVTQANSLLDELVASSTNYLKVFRRLFSISNAEQIKWLIRIILKDLKLNLRAENILSAYHPDAMDYYNLTNSLWEVCKKFQNPNISLNDQIQLFSPIRPMLANKRKVEYFKDCGRTFYVETKFDGERLQAHKMGKQIKLFSRNGIDYNNFYGDFMQLLPLSLQIDSCIVDGEIIVLETSTLKMAAFGMNKLVALEKDSEYQLCYKIFDLLWMREGGEEVNLMKFPLKQRKKMLMKVVTQIPNRVQVVKHQQMSDYDEIIKEFSSSIQRNEEGIMLKDPSSLYIPKQRGLNWLKLKGDYVDGLTDSLDLIIIGGYYGDSSARHGSSAHWTDRITSWLLGLIERIDELNPKIAYAVPFAKVGTGYSVEELSALRDKLKNNLVRNEGKGKPGFIQNVWKCGIQDRPDCYVSSLSASVILEIKAAEIINSDAYPTNHTLRFPRVLKIRYDKPWSQAMKLSELKQLLDGQVYAKNMMRKAGSEGEGQGKQVKIQDVQSQHGSRRRKEKRIKNQILDDFVGASFQGQNIESHIFHGLQFCILPLSSSSLSKSALQILILKNSGLISQNPLASTSFIICDHIDFKLKAYYEQESRKYKFVKPNFIQACISAKKIVQAGPVYLTVMPKGQAEYYRTWYDRFGDSYVDYVDERQLNEIMKAMPMISYCIDERLSSIISPKMPRSQKISFAFNVSELNKLKLSMLGNKFRQNLQDTDVNSIILQGIMTVKQIEMINTWLSGGERDVQYIQDLIH